ncbi:MAG: hypothetical protein KatS3mg121_1187 [Gammaproteobacteria bacterium]|nr:MAG: hypothetical protein KatS3mg121_1187 [Gammaproteobacteria bacterium]
MTNDDTPSRRPPSPWRGRLLLLALAAGFAAPLIGAWWLLDHLQHGGRLWGTVNHGRLVTPPRALEAFELTAADGSPVGAADLRGHWTLLWAVPSPCTQDCLATLHLLQQVWLALGREAPRVRRWLLLEGPPEPAVSAWLERQPGSRAVLDPEGRLRGPLAEAGGGKPVIGIVDPLGNLMEVFDPAADPRGLLQDLRRLLKASKIG